MTVQRLCGISGFVLGALVSIALAGPTTMPFVPVDEIPVPGMRVSSVSADNAPVSAAAPGAASSAAVAAAASVAPVSAGWSKVVILPFDVLGDSSRREWVVRAVQETLSTEVARLGGLTPISAPAANGANDSDAARNAAKTYGGDVVVFGAIQFVGTDVRFTGEAVDVKSGAAVTGLKASGDFRDLFALEDMLSSELGRALRPPVITADQKSQEQSMIFTDAAPALVPSDLYAPASDTQLFGDQYNRYYYDQNTYSSYFGGYGYGGLGYGTSGYGGYGFGFGGIGNYASYYGNYYPPRGGYGYGGYSGYSGYGGYGGGRWGDHGGRSR